jgi:hypothetical protein
MFKSQFYSRYRYAFKFVNRWKTPWPLYFKGERRGILVFGTIVNDLGPYFGDFYYVDRPDGKIDRVPDATSRAFEVRIDLDGEHAENCVVLTHESGLEVFLLATGALIGTETSKYLLKRLLETIEARINSWWQREKKRCPLDYHLDPKAALDDSPQVHKIVVRSPHWELIMDDTFTSAEKSQLVERLAAFASPASTIEELIVGLDPTLAIKVFGMLKRVESAG